MPKKKKLRNKKNTSKKLLSIIYYIEIKDGNRTLFTNVKIREKLNKTAVQIQNRLYSKEDKKRFIGIQNLNRIALTNV